MDKQERLSILDDIIKLQTVNGDEKLVADYLKDLFSKNGIESEYNKVDENRYNLIATINKDSQGPVLGFTGHEDVVDPVEADKWTYGPFNPKHIDGKIIGRGAADMKSGLSALAIAMIELNEDDSFTGQIKFIATVGEEKGEIGAQQLSKEGYADDLSALIVGEPSNGSSQLVINKLAGSGLLNIPQPNPTKFGRNSFFAAHKGSVDYRVISHGKAAHSSMPEAGINAIDNLIKFYNQQAEYFKTLASYEDDALGTTKPAVTVFKAGDQPNTIPDLAYLGAKIRTIPEYDNDKILKDVQDLIDKMNDADPRMNLELVVDSSNLPVKTDLNSKLVTTGREVYKEVWGQDCVVVGAPGGTDASQFVRANPKLEVIVAGPGNESAHQINEFCFEDDYLQYITIYKDIAKKYLA
ncbi:M20/M25/M40 family metallo-hydrolase [Companilactobacillus sp.]|uniref:M20/M25/M40 family metallo-hydrolase n=1 Tax=Companilactobacillus sp. TaxID=2767905 RepID=UPI0025BBF3EE|nr:M20/M25/M40 family metallo-hydrolase [Companilactobacillus sp.]MCH4008196.1 M20/M25/M40 family metallo-hydrolase [Companilactobacillus sp.]MCH4051625.1 M20/M25/M40 family metallo-hydrolase [Companilactobacillus sp.]MCH4076139.1 M20/M25/M40 family metallo-hydrolase [Companilactobacillus sp.]MCH4124714.1 M20/M25/M40 family metallo-hydrolase [Companilactobacillus sp.]MCH4131256.1 M20/M25/M40 family metallo-hydrolase [Companilactobacillus sp.]